MEAKWIDQQYRKQVIREQYYLCKRTHRAEMIEDGEPRRIGTAAMARGRWWMWQGNQGWNEGKWRRFEWRLQERKPAFEMGTLDIRA